MAETTTYRAHSTATIDPGCTIGDGTSIWHYSHVMPGARIGCRCSLGQNVFVARDVTIGDNAKIQNNVSLYDGVTLEEDVFCGPSSIRGAMCRASMNTGARSSVEARRSARTPPSSVDTP